MNNIKKFLQFCKTEDFADFDMADATKMKRGHVANIDKYIQELVEEKSIFQNKYCQLKQRIVDLNKSRISEIKKDDENRNIKIITNDQISSKYKDMYTKYLRLKEEMIKFLENEVKFFFRRCIKISKDFSLITFPDIDKKHEIDSDSEEIENLFTNKNDIIRKDKFIHELQEKFPNHSENFLKYAISDSHISKESYIKKENFRKYENKNNIMLKVTLDSFKIEESQKKSANNLNSQSNNINNILSNTDFVSNIFSEFSEKLKVFFEFYAVQENNSAYILKIGGKLKDGVRVKECYCSLNEIILKNKYTLQGSLYIYRMLEQIFIDMNYTLPENLSQEEFYKINLNISDLYDVRDYFNTIRNSI